MARFPRHALRALRLAATAMLLCWLPVAASADEARDMAPLFEGMRAAEMQLARVGYRLATANAALCDDVGAGTGLVIHTLDQFHGGFREAARDHFGFEGEVAVEGVVPGSPAEAAGVQAGDTLVEVGPVVPGALKGKEGTTDRLVAAQLALADLPPDAPIAVTALRGGERVSMTIMPVPACKYRFELRFSDDFEALSDGTMVQVSSRLFRDYPEGQAVTFVAHEMAHNILRHRLRLEERGVSWGMFSGFGGNVKYFRQTETEADIVSVLLLVNAGYDPADAIRFHEDFGDKHNDSLLLARTHPRWQDRVATIEAEFDRIKAGEPSKAMAIWESRYEPLDGDWRTLLVRAK